MRLVLQLLAVAVVTAVGGLTVAAVQEGSPWLALVLGVAMSALALFVYRWVVGRTEHRAVTEVGRKGAAAGLGLGTLLGLALFGTVVANLALLGYYEVTGRGSVSGAAGFVGLMAVAAVTEELRFRGVLFRVMEERMGTWTAMALSGVVFGAFHLANPDATVYGALAIAVEAGGMLTAAYVATRRLWVPIGVHFGWNFAAAGVFSTEVSGNGSTHGLLESATSGPAFVTGGAFGPEGSVFALLFCALTAVVFLLVARRRGRLVPRGGRAERVAAVATLSR